MNCFANKRMILRPETLHAALEIVVGYSFTPLEYYQTLISGENDAR